MSRGRRWRLLRGAAGAVLVLAAAVGCDSQPGAAVVVAGTTISESTVQQDSTAFLTQNPTVAATDATRALANRAQITFRVRHVLIEKALSAAGVTVTATEVSSATASLKAQQGQSLAAQLDLPASDEPDVIHDLVALQKLVGTLPASGVKVADVSVTAQGVTAANRDQAVSLRSRYLSDPAAMDSAVASAAQGQSVPRAAYDLLKQPELGSTGLYQPSTGGVFILPQKDSYLVLRTTGRTVSTTTLDQSRFNSVSGVGNAFDVGALLVSGQQGSAGISVNPRFGVWDPASVQVVPGNSGL
jgi:hypothetical protein